MKTFSAPGMPELNLDNVTPSFRLREERDARRVVEAASLCRIIECALKQTVSCIHYWEGEYEEAVVRHVGAAYASPDLGWHVVVNDKTILVREPSVREWEQMEERRKAHQTPVVPSEIGITGVNTLTRPLDARPGHEDQPMPRFQVFHMNHVTPDDPPVEWCHTQSGAHTHARICEETPAFYRPNTSKPADKPWAVVDTRPGT